MLSGFDFRVAFYKWSLEDFSREIDDNFPLTSRIKSFPALRMIQHFEKLDRKKRIVLANGLIKKANKSIMHYLDEKISQDELELLNNYFDDVRFPSKKEFEFLMKVKKDKVKISKLINLIKKNNILLTNSFPDKVSKSEINFKRNFNMINIFTEIDVTSKIPIRYEHHICLNDQNDTEFASPTNILKWYGVGPTFWDLFEEHESEDVVSALSDICNHFYKFTSVLFQ